MRFSVSRSEILLRRTQKLKFFIFSLLLVATGYLLVAAFPTFAQTGSSALSATANPYTQPQMNPDVPKNLHTWTQNVMIETMAALTCQLAGIDPVNPNQKCLGVDQKTGNIGFVENGGGAIGLMGNAITMLYTPPSSSGQYFQSLASNFGIAKHAKAQEQGTGFQALSPLLKIWSTFRNITYLLFVIIFVVIGMAIMLRVKIDPRTVMSIQNQIPKIIIGLLLVTFSFAIAGFLIDIMYTSIYLIGNTLVSTDPKIGTPLVTNITGSTNPFAAATYIGNAGIIGIVTGSSDGVKDIVSDVLKGALGDNFGGLLFGNFFGFIIGGLGLLVILIAIIWALFRLWFALISAYVFLLLDIVMAPFWIFAGLLPGSPVGFGLWLRDILSNLSAFPTAIAMFILARVLMDTFAEAGSSAFSPPLVGNLGNSNAFSMLIGLGFILLTPNAVKITKAALKAPKFDTTPIKQAIGVGVGSATRPISGGISYATTPHYEMKDVGGVQTLVLNKQGAVYRALRSVGIGGH